MSCSKVISSVPSVKDVHRLHFLSLSFLSFKAMPWSHPEDSAPKVREHAWIGIVAIQTPVAVLQEMARLIIKIQAVCRWGVGFPESSRHPCVARELCARAAGEFHPQLQSWVGQCNPEKNQDHGALPWCPSHCKSVPLTLNSLYTQLGLRTYVY